MKTSKIIALILAVVMILAFAAGCKGDEKPASTPTPTATGTKAPATAASVPNYRIGVILPMSGGTAFFGDSQLAGYKAVVKYVNETLGGISSLGGAKIELIIADSAGDAETGVSEMERLVTVEKVDAIIGTYNSAVAAAISPLANKYKIPFQVTNAVDDAICGAESKYVFRANPGNSAVDEDNKARAEWIQQYEGLEWGEKVVLCIYTASDYGQSSFENALANQEKNGIKEFIGCPVQAGASDYSTSINIVRQRNDISYIQPIVDLTDALTFIRQLKEYDIAYPVFASGGGFLSATFFDDAGELADYCFTTAHYFNSLAYSSYNPLAKEVADEFLAEKGYVTNESFANGWLGMATLYDAVLRAGSYDKEAVAAAMAETDIKKGQNDEIALIFHQYGGVKYANYAKADGKMVYNQNMEGIFLPWAMAKDGDYRVVWPRELEEKEYPFTWPIPKWSER